MGRHARALLAWYDRHRRELPWRGTRDPYRVWLSEVMLQQTTVAAVLPRWQTFLDRFPTVHALAAAPWEAVAEAWAGLGYYARARNLHAAASVLAARGFPSDEAGWRALPGVGAYTAAAVAAIALDQPAVPVDGNVERVMARLAAIAAPLPGAKPLLAAEAEKFLADPAARARPGDAVQALFDLGATICTPRRPACALCPLREDCRGLALGVAEALPARAPKVARPVRVGAVFWLEDDAGRVLLRRRPPQGLLGGMLELPGTDWVAAMSAAEMLAAAPTAAAWRRVGQVRHVFTHFALALEVFAGSGTAPGLLLPRDQVLAGLPSVMAKAARLALSSPG
jgi:A/G-specific adenine glycosylase